jgi:hypothetical protein
MVRRSPPPITLAELRNGTSWVWVYCEKCPHRSALALAAPIIYFGPEASSDVLRRGSRCRKCGHRGASLKLPSWVDSVIGEEPFPAAG